MKITHLSTHDLLGGAARSALRLHRSLLELGEESRLLTLYKESLDPTVLRFEPPRSLLGRLRRSLRRRYLEQSGQTAASRPEGSGVFSDDRSQHNSDVLLQLPQSDVVNLHWVASFIDYGSFFRGIPSGLPVVWTLHDMNPITGGCHHAADCEGFRTNCGACPQLKSGVENDFSRAVWNRKRQAFDSARKGYFSFVTPSRWLAGKVGESSLAKGFRVSVIPYGLDTEVFRPRGAELSRTSLGIATDAKVVLFASYFSKDSYKGFPMLLEALKKLVSVPKLCVIAVGAGAPEAYKEAAVPIRRLGFVQEQEQMSLIYSAADLFVLPSFQDNFPNTALEALACGTPTVAFDVGGIPEIVRNGQTGITVPPGDTNGLANAIENLLGETGMRGTISANCRRIAVDEYSLSVQGKRYLALYQEALRAN